jgi:hypothetical protein
MVLSKNDNKMKRKIENSTEEIFEKFPFNWARIFRIPIQFF